MGVERDLRDLAANFPREAGGARIEFTRAPMIRSLFGCEHRPSGSAEPLGQGIKGTRKRHWRRYASWPLGLDDRHQRRVSGSRRHALPKATDTVGLGAAQRPPFTGPQRTAGMGQLRPFHRGAAVSAVETSEDLGRGASPRRERQSPLLVKSSSSQPIRANTHRWAPPQVNAATQRPDVKKHSAFSGLAKDARVPEAPTRRGETERIQSVTGSRSP
jgi:hypothetical protein